MAGNGPPPNPNARRRNVRVGLVQLPAGGRDGDAPEWPVGYDPTTAEDAVWASLWALPQAVAWERLRLELVVARYAVMTVAERRSLDDVDDRKVLATLLSAQAKLAPELRQMEDRLGLNPKAMRSLMWEIAADEVGEQRQAHVAARPVRRLKAVSSDAVASQ